MADERAAAALERIERALARVEAAAAKPAKKGAGEGELLELREVHRALRGKVESAIAQIDRLIETAERG
jgi:hypothetical protein